MFCDFGFSLSIVQLKEPVVVDSVKHPLLVWYKAIDRDEIAEMEIQHCFNLIDTAGSGYISLKVWILSFTYIIRPDILLCHVE